MAMLKSGVALAKIECSRDLFEENALALTSVPNMRQLLPFVLRQETTRIIQSDGQSRSRGNSSCEQQLLDYAEVCVTPAYDYFKAKIGAYLVLQAPNILPVCTLT